MSCLENDKIREDFYEKLVDLFQHDREIEFHVMKWALRLDDRYCGYIRQRKFCKILEDLEECIWGNCDSKYPYCQSSVKDFILYYSKE